VSTSRQPIPQTFIDSRVRDAVATLTINRPQAGNALNWALLEQLRSALRQASESPDVRAIVIAAAGSRFVSGADVSFFVRCLQSGELLRIVECIRASQEVFALIAECPKPVVAAVQGAAVGGGVELALACHQIVATPRASFSFPETGLGIVPSSGGTYRTPRRVGVELTKWLVYTGHVLAPPKALQVGLIDQLVMPEQLSDAANLAAQKLLQTPIAVPQQEITRADEFATVRSLFARASVADLRAAELPDDRIASAALKALASRPLPALQWSEKLIDAALAGTPDQGAQAALAAVPILFGDPEVHKSLARVAGQQRQN
jgi:enoyl-CoA hydratase/carnithine racemase